MFEKQAIVPEAKSLSDLFESVAVRGPYVNGVAPKVDKFKIGDSPLESTGYCRVSVVYGPHMDCLTIRPSELAAKAIAGSMIKIDYDLIDFEIIVLDDRSSRVFARYGQIIGSRLLQEFDVKATRAFFRKLRKDLGYQNLPRIKKAS